MTSTKDSELNRRLFHMENVISIFISECQSGLVREESYRAAVAAVRAVTDPHAGSYVVPKHAISHLLRLASYLGDDAPRMEPRGRRMIQMATELWDMIGGILRDGAPPVSPDQDPTFVDDFDWGDASGKPR